jgi:hypothetical protein
LFDPVPVPGQFWSVCITCSYSVRSKSRLLSTSRSIIGLLLITVSGTGICRRRLAGSYLSFNLEFTPPASCCRRIAEAEAEAAAASPKPKQARTLRLRKQPPSVRRPIRCHSTLASATLQTSLRNARRWACRI